MKDMQTVDKFRQSEADKWAKKDQDIRLQVCFKKAIDVEIHLIKGAQALSEAEITAKKTQDSNKNYVIEVVAKNLASADKVDPSKKIIVFGL